MKRGIKIGLALVMIIAVTGLSIIGCTKEEAPAVEEIVLKLAVPHASTNFVYPVHLAFIDSVETESEGRIKIDFYPAQTLCVMKAVPEAVKTGVADMGQMIANYHPAQFPMSDWICLPMTFSSATEGQEWAIALEGKYLTQSFEEAGLRLLSHMSTSPYGIFTAKREIKTLDDLAGLKLKVPGAAAVALVNALGGEGLLISAYEVYEMLAKGTLDGAVHTPAYIHTALWHELGKPGYWLWTGAGLSASGGQLVINKDVYEGLPADLQDVLNEAGKAWGVGYAEAYNVNLLVGLDKFEKAGVVTCTLPDSEIARLKEAADVVWEDWIADWEAKGAPARQFAEDIRKLQKGEKL